MKLKAPVHELGCDCSVCWVKHHCDALAMLPGPQPQQAPLSTVNYADNQTPPLFDCNMPTGIELSGRKAELAELFGRDLSRP